MIPAPITVGGKDGTIVYLDAKWQPVSPEDATMAKVVFFDGSVAFYVTQDTVQKYDPSQLRDEQGRWAKGSGRLGNTYLHGTAQGFLGDILQHGLSGEQAGKIHPKDKRNRTLALPGHVYMTTDMEEAKKYAESAGLSDEFFTKRKETVLNPVYMAGQPRIPEYPPSYDAGTEIGGGLPCVLTIELPPSVVKKLRKDKRSDILTPDPYTPGAKTRVLSPVARSYKGNIKPQWIKSITYQTRDMATGEATWHTIDAKDYHAPGPQTPPYLPQPPGWKITPEWQEYLTTSKIFAGRQAKVASEGTTFYIPLKIPVQSVAPVGIGGITRKFDEAQHPRDKEGRFIEASQPRVFRVPSDVKDTGGTSGGEKLFGWVNEPGHLLTGQPLDRATLPETLYHVTTAGPAVEASGVLLGANTGGGLGGGQELGVSFTASKEDAALIHRELVRAVQVARGEARQHTIEEWAREDEKLAGLPEGSLQQAVNYAMDAWGPNAQSLTHTFVWDDKLPEDKRGYVGPPPSPEEHERLYRGLVRDAQGAYLQLRERTAEKAAGHPVESLKNPMLLGDQRQLAKLTPAHVRILEVPSTQIPATALVTTGSDKYLHEVRVYADVPMRRRQLIAKFDESKVERDPAGTPTGGQFAETGRSGQPTSDPLLAVQAKAGIAAVEKLLPQALKTANFSGVSGAWSDMTEAAVKKVQQEYEEQFYDYVSKSLDTMALDEDVLTEIEANKRDELRTEAQRRFLKTPFGQMLDPTSLVPDPNKTDLGGSLDLDKLRFKHGTPLSNTDKLDARDAWYDHYIDARTQAVEEYQDTDEYLNRREQLVLKKVGELWKGLSDSSKMQIATDMRLAGKLPGEISNLEREPYQWVTGAEVGSKEDDNYARTHAIATRLVQLRTDELRKERGLLEPGTKPEFEVFERGEAPDHPAQYMAKEVASGKVVGFGYTKEAAIHSGEAWATGEMLSASKTETETLIDSVWTHWKTSSSDGLSLSLQLAAARELGGNHRMTEDEIAEAEDYAKHYGGMPTLQAYVRAQWEVTQMVMKKSGTEKLSLYRGLMLAGDQVDAAQQQLVSPLGRPIGPPSNIKVVETRVEPALDSPEKPPQKVTVSFDFNGEHFVVDKERTSPKSITDINPEYWHQVPADKQKEVLDIFMGDLISEGLPSEKAVKLFNKLGDDGKFTALNHYVDQQRIKPLSKKPPTPFESNESAIARRLDKYINSGKVYTKLPNITLLRSGAQSTTGTASVANDWGGVGNLPEKPTRVVLRIETPPTSVLSLPVYGENMQSEHETVVLGTKDKWLWDAWKTRAPVFSSMTINGEPVKNAPAIHDWLGGEDYDSQAFKVDKLILDLQAEDRGKPHWMSSVNWSAVQSVAKFDETKHPRKAKGSAQGGEFTDSAEVLQGVDFKANAKQQIEKNLTQWKILTGKTPSPDRVQAAEEELRALPLIHGTTVAGALGAVDKGLLSHSDMESQTQALVADIDDLKDRIENITGEDTDWGEVPFWTEDDIAGLDLERSDAKALLGYIQELQDIEKVVQGTTYKADKELGLDQFVFMTHGQKHQDYGNVAVVIDNEVMQHGWATEADIAVIGGGYDPDDPNKYSPQGVQKYQSLIVKGDDYYRVAAAHAGSLDFLRNRSREQLFEIKAPMVPKSDVLGFMVEGDHDAAERLVDKLAARGLKHRVLFVDEIYGAEARKFVQDQLKSMQATHMWDEDALETFKEHHEGVYIL